MVGDSSSEPAQQLLGDMQWQAMVVAAGVEESGPSDLWNGTREPSQSWISAATSTVTVPTPASGPPGLNARPALEPRLLTLSPPAKTLQSHQ